MHGEAGAMMSQIGKFAINVRAFFTDEFVTPRLFQLGGRVGAFEAVWGVSV